MYLVPSDLLPQQDTPHERITKLLGTSCKWFIAGGATYSIYTDIDVFFYTEEDFLIATKLIVAESVYSTINADTHSFDSYYTPVQLIKRHFGKPLDIINNFDLNKSAHAIDYNGVHYYSDDFSLPLTIRPANFRNSTMSRFYKYATDKRCITTTNSILTMFSTADSKVGHILDEYYVNSTGNPLIYGYTDFHHFVPSYLGFPVFIRWLSVKSTSEQLKLLTSVFYFNEHFIPLDTMSLTQQYFFASTLPTHSKFYSTIPQQVYSTVPEAFL